MNICKVKSCGAGSLGQVRLKGQLKTITVFQIDP